VSSKNSWVLVANGVLESAPSVATIEANETSGDSCKVGVADGNERLEFRGRGELGLLGVRFLILSGAVVVATSSTRDPGESGKFREGTLSCLVFGGVVRC
jgi:hypothetical protein